MSDLSGEAVGAAAATFPVTVLIVLLDKLTGLPERNSLP